MKKFKTMDAWISTILIISFTIISLINLDYTFLIGYIVVGAWQVISMIVHAVNGWFTESDSKRYIYHWIVVITLMIMLLGFAIYPILIYLLFILLFVSPFMALYYTWLCFDEVRKMNERPLALLK
ncbi:MAG: hypothetical protein JNM14_10035 [Ferruginibacter sp.]|nr:hypothetical protein [Ferruginibacter sp.]